MALSLSAPVSADTKRTKAEFDPRLVELRGEVVSVAHEVGGKEPTRILVLIRNSNYSRERLPGHDAVWTITVDTARLKAAGITKPMLLGRTDLTFVGYLTDNKDCHGFSGECDFAGRQIRFDNGCTAFVGRDAPVFGPEAYAWGWNVPDDGLDQVDRSHC